MVSGITSFTIHNAGTKTLKTQSRRVGACPGLFSDERDEPGAAVAPGPGNLRASIRRASLEIDLAPSFPLKLSWQVSAQAGGKQT